MFEIVWTPECFRDLADVPAKTVTTIRDAVHKYLRDTPHIPQAPRIKRLLHINPPLYRLRAGDFRVYYRLHGNRVVLLAVLNRRDSDRWLTRHV